MNAVLLDTNVLSELVRPKPDERVVAFVNAQPDPYVSVITLHELCYGAERAPNPARRVKLQNWIVRLRAQYADRIVEIDEDIAEDSGRLCAAAAMAGREIDPLDTLIAACALSRAALVATRNIKDFAPLGVPLIDPWSS